MQVSFQWQFEISLLWQRAKIALLKTISSFYCRQTYMTCFLLKKKLIFTSKYTYLRTWWILRASFSYFGKPWLSLLPSGWLPVVKNNMYYKNKKGKQKKKWFDILIRSNRYRFLIIQSNLNCFFVEKFCKKKKRSKMRWLDVERKNTSLYQINGFNHTQYNWVSG